MLRSPTIDYDDVPGAHHRQTTHTLFVPENPFHYDASPLGSRVYNTGAAVGNTAANASSAVGSGLYSTGAAVGSGSAVGPGVYNIGAAVGNTAANTASTIGSTAANAATYIKDTVASYVPETVKDYLPTAVVGSTSPSSTLPTSELGQNTTPQTHSATGPLPGPPGEKDVAVLPNEKLYSQTSLPSVTDSSVPSSKHTLPSQESSHTPSTHHAVGPLPSGENVAVLPGAKTHDLATTGGVADITGDGVAKLPGERELANKEATGTAALPGRMGESNVHGAPKSGADSTASTRTLAGSIAPSTNTDTSTFSMNPSTTGTSTTHSSTNPFSNTRSTTTSTTHPSTTASTTVPSSTTSSTNPFTNTDSSKPSTTTANAHPSSTTKPTTTSSMDKNDDKKGTMDKAKDTFASMQSGAKHAEEKVVPGHKESSKGMRDDKGVSANQELNTTPRSHPLAAPGGTWKGQGVDEKGLDKQQNDGHASAAGERLATASAGAHPHSSTTGAPVANQHPDMSTSPAQPHTGRHAGAVEPRGVDSTDAGKDTSTDAGKDTSKGGKEKVSLKDKIKGEVKVISGKIGGNEEKVEDGKRMMGKN